MAPVGGWGKVLASIACAWDKGTVGPVEVVVVVVTGVVLIETGPAARGSNTIPRERAPAAGIARTKLPGARPMAAAGNA
jgi:hypothetical protein